METNHISRKALLEHLYQIKRLEVILHTYKQTSEKMSEEANKKGKKYHFNAPQMGAATNYSDVAEGTLWVWFGVFACIAFVILRIIFGTQSNVGVGLIDTPLNLLQIGFHLVLAAICGGVLTAGVYFLILAPAHHIRGTKIAKKVYKEERKEYELCVANDNKRVEKEKNEKKELQTQIGTMQDKYAEVEQSLNKLYDLNIVYPKYRGLIPICMFCEYLESGRVTQLTGADGAYNLYENEIRLNLIIVKLEEIASKLEQIQRNQYMLYEALNEINYTANRIYDAQLESMSKLDGISKNLEMVKYNTYVAAENTKATSQWLEWDSWRKTLKM